MALTTQDADRQWAREQIEKYRSVQPRYAKLAKVLQQVLEPATKQHAPLAIVQTRPKAVASFAEKAQRKKNRYRDPLNRMTDLCGGRVITHTHTEVEAICKFIEAHFEIDRDNTVDVSQRLKPSEFGYRSIHYIVQFKRGVFPTKEINVEIPDEILPDPDCPMKAEIQVRTLLEHAWADFGHDQVYKSEFVVPAKWERELAGLAAILEKADDSFAKILDGLKTYSANYGAYLNEEQVKEEFEILEAVLDCDPHNPQVAHRLGKMAMTLGDWQKAIDIFSKFVESGYQPILRDLGVTLCQLYAKDSQSARYREGQKYLQAASAAQYRDADALASFAGSWKNIDEERARTLYRQAFEVDPSDPYAVSNYLVYEIAYRRDITPISLMMPAISAAMERCRNQADVGMNLPWAFYNLGIFHLLLGQPYESLSAYAKALQLSTNGWTITTSLRALERLGTVRHELEGYEWARRLLLIGSAVKFQRDDALDQIKPLALPNVEPIAGPVVVVAGSCDASFDPQLQTYRELLIDAFRNSTGTIISGGTTAGISGLVGDLQQAYPQTIRTIGYIPKLIPADVLADSRYLQIRKTDGKGFSATEPLQYWIDLLASGILPGQVKLLGIGGGVIAAAEFRIALALGASVGLIEGSGREAAKLILDAEWNSGKSLLRLPADAMTLRAFVGTAIRRLEPATRETIARSIHEAYRHHQYHQPVDLSLAEWDALLESLKESNRNQADHIEEKLGWIGCALRKAQEREVALMKFSESEIERMAEMEHGRWVVERLQDGWRWGATRDVIKKTSPHLVPWTQLSDEIKERDRTAVRTIPELLAQEGIEIFRG